MRAVKAPAWRRVAFPVGATALVVAATTVALIWAGLVDWADSVCNGTPAELAAKQRDLRQHVPLIWCAAASVPAVCAVLAVRSRRRAWPWALVAAVLLAVAVAHAAFATPSTWCF